MICLDTENTQIKWGKVLRYEWQMCGTNIHTIKRINANYTFADHRGIFGYQQRQQEVELISVQR